MEGVFIVFCALLFIALVYAVGKEFQRIAQMKGHNEKRYFWWSFLLGIAGWAMVIALPDRANQKDGPQISNDELPDL